MMKYLVRWGKRAYSSSLFLSQLFQKITSLPFYSGLMRKKITRQITKDKKGPFNLVIETSSICNARCLVCPYVNMKRKKQVMDEKTFETIIKRIKKERMPINKVFLSGMGEPLIDKGLIERIRTLKKMGLWIRLYTNASLLTQKASEELISIGLDEINISFNGTNRSNYGKVMGLDFDKTVKNIKSLVMARNSFNKRKPLIQTSLIATKENEKDIRNYLERWQGVVDLVTVTKPHQWGGGVKIKSKLAFNDGFVTYPCRSLWHTFVIDSAGNFVVCCRDYESNHILGNVKKDSFSKIREKTLLKEFRKKHLRYSLEELPPICKQCNFPYQGGVEWFMPRSLD